MERTASESELNEADLVSRARAGCATAFAALVSRYEDRVFNTCYRMCRNHADALDLTQTTFLKALEGLARFDARSSFYTWIFRIAVNATLSHCRKAARRRMASLDGDDDAPRREPEGRTDVADAGRQAEQRELHDAVERALEQLDDDFRIAVVLKDVEGMDYATIGEILNAPIGTVKSRIFRGRMMLRELLSAERTTFGAA